MKKSNQMHGLTVRLKQLIRNFSDDSGATTVEFVLWVPMFMFILMITVDVSLLFLRQSNLWYVARDTARQISIRQLKTPAEAEYYAEQRGTFGGDEPTATVFITNTETQVRLQVPMAEVGIFGILNIGGRAINLGNSGDLIATVTQRLEPI